MKRSGLTPRQKAFVREYLVDMNATQAAIRAKYSAKTAEQQGPRLLGNVGVAAAIAAAQAKRSAKVELTAEMVVRGLLREANGEGPDTNPGARVSAFGLLAKHLGMLIDKHQLTGKDGEPVKFTLHIGDKADGN